MNTLSLAKREMIWPNILFFAVTTFVALVGPPLYLARFEPPLGILWLTVFYLFATSMSITVGYHRLFSHVTYKTNPVMEFFLLFFGAAAYQQSAFFWSSQHRTHHLAVDSDADPYSIKKGFFYAHIGWLLFWKHPEHFENVKDLQKNRLVMHQHKYYQLWGAFSGIILPMLFGYWHGDLLGAFIFPVCLRLVLVHHSTFAINSVCHTFGKATYDIYSSAKDHWLVALITNGEGYHNFHHHFPNDYRNGVRWYQWDPSKWFIALLAKAGLARDLRRVSSFRIIAARLAAEHQRAEDFLKSAPISNLEAIQLVLKSRYEKLRQTLTDWESSAREYQQVLRQHLERQGSGLARALADRRRQAALRKRAARRQFRETLQQWRSICFKLKAA